MCSFRMPRYSSQAECDGSQSHFEDEIATARGRLVVLGLHGLN